MSPTKIEAGKLVVFHKKIRLSPQIYRDKSQVCLVTICTKGRVPIFKDATFSKAVIDLLKSSAKADDMKIFVYCFMPDHVHLLLAPSEKQGIIDFVRTFKSLSTRLAWQCEHSKDFWQKSFYDHFLREEEDLETVAQYILNNPVRKGLVQRWQDYPFSGSFVLELET